MPPKAKPKSPLWNLGFKVDPNDAKPLPTDVPTKPPKVPTDVPTKVLKPGEHVSPDPGKRFVPEKHVDKYKKEPPPPAEREKGWKEGQADGRQKFDNMAEAAKSGDPQKVRDSAIDMQMNKQSLYEGNRNENAGAPETRTKFKEEMGKIYAEADAEVNRQLSQKYETDVRKKDISNPRKPGADPTKMSIDRDVTFERKARIGELVPDESKPGKFVSYDPTKPEFKDKDGNPKEVWVDIPAKESGKVYNEKFKEAALKGASPEARAKYGSMSADEFAKKMDQTVTDRLANDAYGRGPSDLTTAMNPKELTNKFSDPAGVGKTAEFKANEWYEKAERDATTPTEHETYVAEGMRQTSKQYRNQVQERLDALNAKRGGEGQPPKVKPPEDLKNAYKILEDVEEGNISPAEAEMKLKNMPLKNKGTGKTKEDVARDLGDFINTIYRMPVEP